jgi:hypothetical protein
MIKQSLEQTYIIVLNGKEDEAVWVRDKKGLGQVAPLYFGKLVFGLQKLLDIGRFFLAEVSGRAVGGYRVVGRGRADQNSRGGDLLARGGVGAIFQVRQVIFLVSLVEEVNLVVGKEGIRLVTDVRGVESLHNHCEGVVLFG